MFTRTASNIQNTLLTSILRNSLSRRPRKDHEANSKTGHMLTWKGDIFLPFYSHQDNELVLTKSSSIRHLTWCTRVFTCFIWTESIPGMLGKDKYSIM